MNVYEDDLTVEKAYAMEYERGFRAVLEPLTQYVGEKGMQLLLSPVQQRGLSIEELAFIEVEQLKAFVDRMQKRYDELEEV